MTIKEKASYLKGMIDGLELKDDTKESKLFTSIVDLLDDMASSITDLQYEVDDVVDQLDDIDNSLCNIEGSCSCEEDNSCEEDGCDHCEHDDIFYEVECPKCKIKICLSEKNLFESKIDCPTCGEPLEFDINDSCNCNYSEKSAKN